MKKLIFTILVFLIGMLQAQSQIGFVNSEKHKATKQKLMEVVKGDFQSSIDPNTSFKQKNLKSGTTDYGNAPDWNWATQFGGSGTDYGRDVITDDVGNVYITGSFSGEISIVGNTCTSESNRDVIVAKFDNLGSLVWLKQFSAPVNEAMDSYGICLDGSGNIFMTGYYTGSVTLGGITLPNYANHNLFFAKLNTSGEVLMAKNHDSWEDTEIGLKIDTDNSGNIYLLGSTNTSTYFRHPTIILKYDQLGNII